MIDETLLVTGSSGLIGSAVVENLFEDFEKVYGIDNNMRAVFFGNQGDTRWNQKRLESQIPNFTHIEADIRDRKKILDIISEIRPSLLVHTAAQPSHDLAAQVPFDDFDVNAIGTLNLLEASRRYRPDTVFVHMSTNKVYGDAPNRIKLKELKTRWDYDDPSFDNGIDENFTIDQSKHSLFGASKAASDIIVQEYGRYFNMRSCCLRGGCLTGPSHSGVELHGFLSYLIKCNLEKTKYSVYGYKGKQVRDNIHSYDVAQFIRHFYANPRIAEVYNLGGGRDNSISILEAFAKIGSISGINMDYEYVEKNREGDHICYISNLAKMKSHYPEWDITKSLDDVFLEIYEAWERRLNAPSL
jgi:CDP-paratose 2-epimerase